MVEVAEAVVFFGIVFPFVSRNHALEEVGLLVVADPCRAVGDDKNARGAKALEGDIGRFAERPGAVGIGVLKLGAWAVLLEAKGLGDVCVGGFACNEFIDAAEILLKPGVCAFGAGSEDAVVVRIDFGPDSIVGRIDACAILEVVAVILVFGPRSEVERHGLESAEHALLVGGDDNLVGTEVGHATISFGLVAGEPAMSPISNFVAPLRNCRLASGR